MSRGMKEKRVLIVGAGCFGLSTAYHFLQSNQSTSEGAPGHPTYKVTVLDASTTIPAPDAASSDLNKIVRSSYSDKFYTQLAREAISLWKEGNICGNNTYHESGVLVLGLKGYVGVGPDETIYANLSLQNDIDAGANVKLFANPSDILAVLPEGAVAGSLFEAGGAYLNSDGGWASASEAMKALLDNVRHMGGEVIGGSKMTDLIFGEKPGDRVVGVMLEEGRAEYADVVVLAMGAWTPSILGNIEPIMNDTLTATGQTLATIKLSREMAERYKNIPVLVDWSTGFYMFPPNKDNIIKFALHAEGYTYIPPSTKVPHEVLKHLHERLQAVYPELAQIPLDTTRLCWYTDTPDEDWIIDQVPQHPGLFLATGGSGHAFKFLPVIGRLVKHRVEGKLDSSVAARFAIGRDFTIQHGSRHGYTRELDEGSLLDAKDYNEYLQHK